MLLRARNLDHRLDSDLVGHGYATLGGFIGGKEKGRRAVDAATLVYRTV